ncbi:PGAP1-like protein-domain-containing protein [Lipomyces oligophaga]|uniref:PGAP1-like protein-domain-containing protein n=1 Tax=Lipomyces oligophaga TaxID=45792 RepID=UPI0034CFE730
MAGSAVAGSSPTTSDRQDYFRGQRRLTRGWLRRLNWLGWPRWPQRWIFQGNSSLSVIVMLITLLSLGSILYSFVFLQQDVKGCRQVYMAPSYARIKSFDTSITRFASKYALYLYREQGLDLTLEPNGVPVLFIPGNAGSYKQGRSIAAEAAHKFYDTARARGSYGVEGVRNLDFFTADFNEDLTAFHGRTLLDQAEYLNDAIEFILSLYASTSSSHRPNSDHPLPRSVILIGHSMGGIVARTMLTLPNYRPDSVNTIITLSTPHVVPPATFDWDIVKIYNKINQYWRESFSDKLVGRNPLASVSVISIAGGKLDQIVPSDYSSTSSLMPSTNGFTVFTTGIPTVWTGVDHLAIVWCDQLRKAIVKSLLGIIDDREPTQTTYLDTRMNIFREVFLTELGKSSLKYSPLSLSYDTLLKVPNSPSVIVHSNSRVILRGLGKYRQPRAYLIPIPKNRSPQDFFSIMTDQSLEIDGKDQRLDVMLCEQTPENVDYSSISNIMDFSKQEGPSLNFLCSNSAPHSILLPASTSSSQEPFEGNTFSYLQYKLEDILRYEYIAIIDSYVSPTSGFLVAEIVDHDAYEYEVRPSLAANMHGGARLQIPAESNGFMQVTLTGASSSLVSYKLQLNYAECGHPAIFAPLVRQYIDDPHESKYFPNAREIDVSFYGSAPFVPMTTSPRNDPNVKFQIWVDPSCNAHPELIASVDLLGSLGNVVMRFRTVLAALPLAIVGMVVLIQFNEYDSKGVFISFGAAFEYYVVKVLPILILLSSVFSVTLSLLTPGSLLPFIEPLDQTETNTALDEPIYRTVQYNNMFLGTTGMQLMILGPVLFTIASGLIIIMYYILYFALFAIAQGLEYSQTRQWNMTAVNRIMSHPFPSRLIRGLQGGATSFPFLLTGLSALKAASVASLPMVVVIIHTLLSGNRRILATFVLCVSVFAYVPYQFAFVVGFLVHTSTCIKSLCLQKSQTQSGTFTTNFTNFSVSMLMVMVWLLPVNIPVLIVWIHNLSVRWNLPFSSHHNILAIMPLIALVERMISGKMVPRATGIRKQMITKGLLVYLITYAIIHGVLHAYLLHYIVNIFAFWLVVLYIDESAKRARAENAANGATPGTGTGIGGGTDYWTKSDKRP